jgi:hypothetical protein
MAVIISEAKMKLSGELPSYIDPLQPHTIKQRLIQNLLVITGN